MKTNFERLQMESTTIKSHYIINELKSFMQSFKTLEDDKLRSFSISGNIITIEMTINVSNSSYYSDRIIIETKISYNLFNDTYKITCHGEGARKHNYDAKRFAGYILQGMQERAGACFVGDMSEVNSLNQFYFYDLSKENNITNTALLNQLHYKLSHENMSVSSAFEWIEENKPVEVVEVAATIQETPETYYIAFNRSFSTFQEAYNHCIACDFSPEYIEEVGTIPASQMSPNNLEMDLQYFAEPLQPIQSIDENQRLSFNYYDVLSLSHKEWESDVNKHNNKYLQLRDNEKLSQSDILDLINSNYQFNMSVINAEPYFNPDCILVDVTLCYINKGLTKYIPKSDYIYISKLYNYKNVINQ